MSYNIWTDFKTLGIISAELCKWLQQENKLNDWNQVIQKSEQQTQAQNVPRCEETHDKWKQCSLKSAQDIKHIWYLPSGISQKLNNLSVPILHYAIFCEICQLWLTKICKLSDFLQLASGQKLCSVFQLLKEMKTSDYY